MISAVIERLQDRCMPPLKLVDGAAAFAELQAPPPSAKWPAAYVIPLGSAGGPNRLVGATRQSITERISIVLFHGNVRDGRGKAAALELVDVRDAVRAAMVGWRIEGWEPFTLARGQLMRVNEGVLAWQEEFTCDGHLRGS